MAYHRVLYIYQILTAAWLLYAKPVYTLINCQFSIESLFLVLCIEFWGKETAIIFIYNLSCLGF